MQDANNIGANGRYVIERVLGEQTVGRYVVAVDTIAGGRVTILVPAAQAVRPQRVVDALQHEIERLRPLNDTAYCTLKDAGLTDDGQPFAVVNRPQGGSLAALLRSEGRLSPDRAVSIAIQLCDLVRRAHVLGVFPASLDPDSIIVDSQPGGRARVSVVDFGLARGLFGPTAQNASRARSSLFDAPQIRGGEEADPRDDVFAITALLHALILGSPPRPWPRTARRTAPVGRACPTTRSTGAWRPACTRCCCAGWLRTGTTGSRTSARSSGR
jgi:serine/threonine protein kinase